jgi:cytochrome oxidase assembly protein ShyY1
VTFVAVVIMSNLGMWQLDRMALKEQRLLALKAKSKAGSIGLIDLPENLEDASDYPVEFSGVANIERVLLLDNKIVNGTVGYEVLVPVETNVGTVLVNYGWVKAGAQRGELPTVNISAQLQTYSGNVVIPALNPMVKETNTTATNFPLLVQQIDLELLNKMTGLALQPFIVSMQPNDSAFTRNWNPVVMAPEKHLGYAIQWFGLAIAAIVIYFFAVFKRKPV